MSNSLRRASLLVVSSCLMLGLAACKKADSQNKAQQRKLTVTIGDAAAPGAVTANVAEFDPNADISLDMDSYGSERPDSYEVQQAFFAAFEGIGGCVEAEHQRRKTDKQFPGDVAMAVKLNPQGPRPYGVNATMPSGFEKSDKLKNCMREAVGEVAFPKYDGPPVVVNFEFELDPGWIEVEE